MASRIYFIDALTGTEIDTNLNGREYSGTGACGASPRTGIAYDDATWSVEVVMGRGEYRTVTAADFPGRLVIAKMWHPGRGEGERVIQNRLLIAREDGFATLNEVAPRGQMSRGSCGDAYRKHERGEILRDRNALAWIARRRGSLAA